MVHVRTRPTAFPWQHGLILPQESHCELPFVPVELAGGLGILLEQRADMVGVWCSLPTPPSSQTPTAANATGMPVFFSARHTHKNNLLVVQKEQMKFQGLSCPGCSSSHPLQPLAVPQFLYVQAGVQILTTEGCSGS